MRVLIQRVKEATVVVGGETVGSIGKGLLVFLGVHKEDSPTSTTWLVNKLDFAKIKLPELMFPPTSLSKHPVPLI